MIVFCMVLAVLLPAQEQEDLYQQALEACARGDAESLRGAWELSRGLDPAKGAEVEARIWCAAEVWPMAAAAVAEARRGAPGFALEELPYPVEAFSATETMVDGGMTYVRFTYDAWTP
ncbi:MAG: hypothetical protein ACYTAF_14085, partial [Planctomycetota bacterium]